jgi:hypothetical protein
MDERGGALVEFALVSVVLYLLMAGAIDFGRLMFDANALQDVARVAAREMALAPVRADVSFDYALSCDAATDANCLVDLKARVFDPACLVVNLDDPVVAEDPEGYFAAMPVVNRQLRTLMITEPTRPNLLRYAGALLSDDTGATCSAVDRNGNQAAPTGLTVGIPLITERDASGVESIKWVPVVEEIRAAADADCPLRGPFSLIYLANQDDCGPLTSDPLPDRGLVAVRINYPFQAATLSGFQSPPASDVDPIPINITNPIIADDGGVLQNNAAPGAPIDVGAVGPYSGPFGLGRQFALAGQTVRPFRKLISAQAIYRREVVE